MKIKFLLLCFMLSCGFLHTLQAQSVEVTGTVTNKAGEPLRGASVIIRGTNTGTTTDASGNYKITLPRKGDVLVISYTGLTTQELTITRPGPLNVQLDNTNAASLNEVVVVGYGQQRRSNVTGAIATVSTKELVRTPVTDMSNALQGRVPGIITKQASGEPGADAASIYIRGVSTFGGSNEPLYVVDGIVRDKRDFSQLDANEIESVSVLKDASSAAIFGVKGANGVILVTTKTRSFGQDHCQLFI